MAEWTAERHRAAIIECARQKCREYWSEEEDSKCYRLIDDEFPDAMNKIERLQKMNKIMNEMLERAVCDDRPVVLEG